MTATERTFAFLFKTTTEDTSQTLTSLQQALELAEAGHDVEIYLDGAATAWPAYLDDHPDSPVAPFFEDGRDRGLFAGACGLCSVNFTAVDSLQAHGIEVIGDGSYHSIDTAALVAEGFELVVVS